MGDVVVITEYKQKKYLEERERVKRRIANTIIEHAKSLNWENTNKDGSADHNNE